MELTQVEKDKQEIRKVCLEVMQNKKAKDSARLQGARLLAGIQRLYGPGRPRVLARGEDLNHESKELNNQEKARPSAADRMRMLVESMEDYSSVQLACNTDR